MTATFFPYPAALLAQAKPPRDYNSILILPEPPPITIKSKCNIELIFLFFSDNLCKKSETPDLKMGHDCLIYTQLYSRYL